MSLLLDRLLVHGADPTSLPMPDFKDVATVPILNAQSAADYFYLGSDQEYWHMRDDFPCVAAPWPQFWIEWRTPHVSNSGGKIVPLPGRLTWGLLIEQRDVADATLFDPNDHRPEILRFAEVLQDTCRWVLNVGAFLEAGHQRLGTRFALQIGLDHDGRVAEYPARWGGTSGEVVASVTLPERGGEPGEQRSLAIKVIHVALFALSLMHCKNVRREEITPPAALSKAAEKRTGQPLLRYHVLDVNPFRLVAEKSGSGVVGMKRALHICRQHFAVYTAEKPLFGKYVGQFWIPQHLRGKIANGSVAKDYRLVGIDRR